MANPVVRYPVSLPPLPLISARPSPTISGLFIFRVGFTRDRANLYRGSMRGWHMPHRLKLAGGLILLLLVLLVVRRYSTGEIPAYPRATNSNVQQGSSNNDYTVITTTFQTTDAPLVVAHFYDVELQQRGFSSEANINVEKAGYLNFVRMVERFPLSSFFTIKPYLVQSITI